MTTTMLLHRRSAPVRRLGAATDLRGSRSAALEAWQRHTVLVVPETSVADGEANRRRLVRGRRARRALRSLGMPLILAVAAAGGLAIGRTGESTRPVRPIAPTRQPVYHAISTASPRSLVLMPASHAAR